MENIFITLTDVSKWYGEILGVNRVTIELKPGFSGLVGPNGSGKTTLLNLICGFLKPCRGEISVCGVNPRDTRMINRLIGYVHQFDENYPQLTGLTYLTTMLSIDGYSREESKNLAEETLVTVNMADAGNLKVGTYSKGMKQRLKIARALARKPQILILDEPLAGLDPVSRRELSNIFTDYADDGHIVLMSSHILAEIEHLTRKVILLDNGSIVAEGDLDHVRQEIKSVPMKINIRSSKPESLVALLFNKCLIQAAAINELDGGITINTNDADVFLINLNKLAAESQFDITFMTIADDSIESIYRYLIYPSGE